MQMKRETLNKNLNRKTGNSLRLIVVLFVAVLAALAVGLLTRFSSAAPIPSLTVSEGSVDGGTTTKLSAAMQGKGVAQISSAASGAVVLGNDGRGYSWGSGANGRLGNGSASNASAPIAISTSGAASSLAGKKITTTIAVINRSYAITSDGDLYAWGKNNYGQLFGDGRTINPYVPYAVDMTGELTGKTITQIAGGINHTLALTSDGALYSWGRNNLGQLGDGTTVNSSMAVPVDMTGALAGKTITQIAGGQDYSLVVTSDGDVFGWGQNNFRQLGDGTATDSPVPVAVDMTGALAGRSIVQVSTMARFVLALASDGTLYAWGTNGQGSYGDGTTTGSLVPVAVDMSGALADKTVVQISAGYSHGMALTSDGELYAWGANSDGQLGDGTLVRSLVPVAVDMTGALAGTTITQIAGGQNHSLVLTSDGDVYGWGQNTQGQLGNGTTDRSTLPVKVNPIPAIELGELLSVTFGGVEALSFEELPNGEISAVTPAHVPGPVDVVFTFASGQTISVPNGFTYTAPDNTDSDDADNDAEIAAPGTPSTPNAPDAGVGPSNMILTVAGFATFLLLTTAGVAYNAKRRRSVHRAR